MYICPLPTPHHSKLTALAQNRKLPPADKPRVEDALERYADWVNSMNDLDVTGADLLHRLVELLNQYKRYLEVELIYDSPADFLYRQKGQHKVDNSVLEEFLPRLADTRLVPGLTRAHGCVAGPQTAFAAFTFGEVSTQSSPMEGFSSSRKTKTTLCRNAFTSRPQLTLTSHPTIPSRPS
jgi:hypothetical protein